MTSAPTSPGWYDDPDDAALLRYFDGVVWTAHTVPRRSPTAEQSTIGRSSLPATASGPPAAAHDGGAAYPQQQYGSVPSTPYGSSWATRRDVLPDGAVLAEWWRRLLARLIDWVVTGILTAVVAWPFLQDVSTAFGSYLTDSVEAAERGAAAPDQTAVVEALTDVILPLTVIGLAVRLVYEIGFLAWRGATPGKLALGTVVRRVSAPGRLSVVDAARRQAISVVTAVLGVVPILSLLGFVLSVVNPAWLLWDPRRQALHDKVADTVVVLRARR
jgi:uncharacterized RDD family membrane protein YckC